jgi:hypothetical protein
MPQKLTKAQAGRLTNALAHTQGTMPITMVITPEELEPYEAAKKGRKWSGLVDFKIRKEEK